MDNWALDKEDTNLSEKLLDMEFHNDIHANDVNSLLYVPSFQDTTSYNPLFPLNGVTPFIQDKKQLQECEQENNAVKAIDPQFISIRHEEPIFETTQPSPPEVSVKTEPTLDAAEPDMKNTTFTAFTPMRLDEDASFSIKPLSSLQSRDRSPMDNSDLRPSLDEYNKLSSKEKRQLRNKISARNFRNRRKEYIGLLEEQLTERDSLIKSLQEQISNLRLENTHLQEELRVHKSKTTSTMDVSKILTYLEFANALWAGSDATTTTSPLRDSDYELNLLRSEYDRRIQAEQHAYQTLELQMRSQTRELEALKCQRVEVLQEWESERAAHQEKQDAWMSAKAQLEELVSTLRSDTLHLKSEVDDLQSRQCVSESEAHTTMSHLQSDLLHARSELDIARSQNENLSKSNATLRDRISELENSQPMLSQSNVDTDNKLLKDQLSQQIQSVQRLEAANVILKSENARLSDASTRMQILHETNKSLEAKLERMNILQESLLDKEAELTTMREEQEHWISVLSTGLATEEHTAFTAAANVENKLPSLDIPSQLTPEKLPQYISMLRGTIMGLQARLEGVNRSMEQLRSSNIDLSNRAAQGTEAETVLQKKLGEQSEQLLRTQKRCEIQADEINRYKELLDSFEQEACQGNSQYEESYKLQIKNLEEKAKKLQAELDETNMKLVESQKVAPPTVCSSPSNAHKEEMAALEKRCKVLEDQLSAASEENDALWTRVGRGEYNVANERCITLSDNPVSRDYAIRSSTLEALKKENEGLLTQLQSLQKQSAGPSSAEEISGNLIPMQTVENLRAELARLQEAIHLKDKGMLRLKQVFTAKANEFREAVQSLFGYKVRFLENGKVKLTSAYARGARVTTLVFRSEEGNVGEMKLQGEANEGLANVAHLRDYWLSDGIRHSVPCFLAALNLELYENTTQAIRGSFGTMDVE
ncbi:[phosphatase 2A protein]-leucine-carboxy methyltransferase [Malassezia caprae]|uniref:Spindle assembly checkpoint component MAD1 n=1 Tax=Malassezia caprae TaxID=1381934 RepID=A0AAF0IXN4_9BASI|nr:[phosphatase 2A protein]-leucine-carboxy methyltransferase [Malassezia caprae]